MGLCLGFGAIYSLICNIILYILRPFFPFLFFFLLRCLLPFFLKNSIPSLFLSLSFLLSPVCVFNLTCLPSFEQSLLMPVYAVCSKHSLPFQRLSLRVGCYDDEVANCSHSCVYFTFSLSLSPFFSLLIFFLSLILSLAMGFLMMCGV